MRNVLIVLGVVILITGALLLYNYQTESRVRYLTISTTTSLYDTGLLDVIGEIFKREYNIELRFIPKGTGAAIQDAKNGVCDAIIVHARNKELEFMEEGYGINRKVFAYNYFVILGPEDDPAGIRGLPPVEALKRIAKEGREGKIIWVTRDDGSGTNTKEIDLWKLAGYNYSEIKNEKWVYRTGSGMGETLKVTDAKGGYTLSDTATYLKYRGEGIVDNLDILVERGSELINIYSIILINPEKYRKNYRDAVFLSKWLTGEEGQRVMGEFGREEFGRPLFNPVVDILEKREDPPFTWILRYGFIEDGNVLTECPRRFRYGNNLTFFEFKIDDLENN
ncbi:MAG TPA: tungsten ABC transporter permease [Methanothermococcus okinawensis]|uniref:Tungsten ABC transporter permease n=1 Tax=Methanothermococcus okinawensis TaxID=155863 RepID=A0A832ZAS2_9EURY|nr:tungsten ABC transporter permease [Methanococcaceae archaeon]HIP84494.1 tungsten ABC transporter permease [Methanothermococcus okinawensis]HIP91067.1 tungsten ABC transporter permease [Methanothermococcus okinawensis]